MLLPCKTIQQIRNHLRIARLHNEGQVNQRNPLYQIIIQALEGVCHLRFPFERPVARYGTLQMWPEEERPIWYNKFLRNFCTNGPTEIIPRENVSDRKSPDVAVSDAPLVGIPSVYSMSSPTQSNNGIASCSVTYEVDVNFHHNNDHLMSCVDAQPTSYCYESANASFPSSCAVTTAQSQQNAPHAANICISDPYRSKETNVKDELEIHQRPTTSYSQLNSEESHQKLLDSSVTNIGDLMIVDDNAKPDVSALSLNFPFHSPSSSLAEPQFSVFEPNKDFIILPTVHPEEMQLPKSEFSFRPELEEGEIISEESSLDAPKKRGRRSILKNSPSNRGGIKRKRAGTHRKRREHVSKSGQIVRDGNLRKISTARDQRNESKNSSSNRARSEQDRVNRHNKRAYHAPRFCRTPLRLRTSYSESIGRFTNRHLSNNGTRLEQTYKYRNAYQARNEAQDASRKSRSKRRLISPESGSVGCSHCSHKRRRHGEDSRIEKDIGMSNRDRHVEDTRIEKRYRQVQ